MNLYRYKWTLVALCIALAILAYDRMKSGAVPQRKQATVEDRVAEHGPAARGRWQPSFDAAGVVYPPKSVTLAGFKLERRLEVYAAGEDGTMRWIRSYPILAARGTLGPKLKEGDRQVPEGVYQIEAFNPNSRFHLSLRLNYPNEFDQAKAALDGRTNLGGDIMIHGGAESIGCLAMGDEAIEDVFVLSADVGRENVAAILSPVDFRQSEPSATEQPTVAWYDELQGKLHTAVAGLPLP